MERAAEEYGLGKGQYFKVKEGANKIRLLSPCIPYRSEYKGQVNVKFPAWIIDRADGVIKLYFMPQTILNAIGGLQMSDDFGFVEVPMPYDLTIMAKNAGTKEVEYTVVGARNNTPLQMRSRQISILSPQLTRWYKSSLRSKTPLLKPLRALRRILVASRAPRKRPELRLNPLAGVIRLMYLHRLVMKAKT